MTGLDDLRDDILTKEAKKLAVKEQRKLQRRASAISLAIAYGKWQGIEKAGNGIPPFKQAIYGIFVLMAAGILMDDEASAMVADLFKDIRKSLG